MKFSGRCLPILSVEYWVIIVFSYVDCRFFYRLIFSFLPVVEVVFDYYFCIQPAVGDIGTVALFGK